MAGEGATEFEDIEGGGIGEGEGAKDVSDQIETEDQLDEAKRPGEHDKADDKDDQSEIPAEDNAIEMSDDFDGKMHDQPEGEKSEEDDDEEEKKEEEMDTQMGEADGEENERLDDKMWGSDEEEEEDQEEQDTKDDNKGGGSDRQMEEMVAKDENKGKADERDDDDEPQKNKNEEEVPQENLLNEEDDYDDDKVDPPREENAEKDAENLDLPDDLNLDDGEKKSQEEEEMETEEKGDNEEKKENEEETKEDLNEEEGDEKETQGSGEDEDNGEDDAADVGNLKAEKPEEEEEDKAGDGEEGNSAHEEEKPSSELRRERDEMNKGQDQVDTVEDSGDANDQVDLAESKGGGTEQDAEVEKQEEENQERAGVGAASAEDQDGHMGQKSSQTSDTQASNKQKQLQRNPGKSDSERTLGSKDKEHRRLKTKENSKRRQDEDGDEDADDQRHQTAEEYEHITESKSHWDAQTVDAATLDQTLEKQAMPSQEDEDGGDVDEDDDVRMEDEKEEDLEDSEIQQKQPAKSREQAQKDAPENEADKGEEITHRETVEVEGENVLTLTTERPPESSIHTVLENMHIDSSAAEVDIDDLRSQLEQCVTMWSHPEDTSPDMMKVATEAWQNYLTVTGSLSQELCEQLRLILEPSKATKLRGDYRTGKRLNMRKVIPYIASQFRKDKIWLRRSKPSKREYQVMLAVDDSSSMADNHTKQLAFESLALVANALTLLESGELAVCSFGEEVRLLHPFSEPFTNQSGARILQQLSCEQKQTKYGLLLDTALSLMQEARVRQPGSVSGNLETAQLLLVLSDGHGVFREGMDVVKRAVRRARSARIFLVFVVMDNPDKKGSLLDARVPIMEPSGKVKEIKSYMEMFPFPFYIMLRDINSMPQILSDALRQWFEVIAAADA